MAEFWMGHSQLTAAAPPMIAAALAAKCFPLCRLQLETHVAYPVDGLNSNCHRKCVSVLWGSYGFIP
jgi:hypothetical protein